MNLLDYSRDVPELPCQSKQTGSSIIVPWTGDTQKTESIDHPNSVFKI